MKINITPEDCKFHVDEKNRKVVCILEGTEYLLREYIDDETEVGNFFGWHESQRLPNRFVGIATCAEGDKWDEAFGRRLAFLRAKRSFYKTMFAHGTQYFDHLYKTIERAMDTINALGAKVTRNVNHEEEYVDKYLNGTL